MHRIVPPLMGAGEATAAVHRRPGREQLGAGRGAGSLGAEEAAGARLPQQQGIHPRSTTPLSSSRAATTMRWSECDSLKAARSHGRGRTVRGPFEGRTSHSAWR